MRAKMRANTEPSRCRLPPPPFRPLRAPRFPTPFAVALYPPVGSAARRMVGGPSVDAAFATDMAAHPIAAHTQAANDQHYELPAAFFNRVLGPNLKYSSCLYEPGDDLGAAEARALAATCNHADNRATARMCLSWAAHGAL